MIGVPRTSLESTKVQQQHRIQRIGSIRSLILRIIHQQNHLISRKNGMTNDWTKIIYSRWTKIK